jgi:hypothetical protein
VEIVDAGVIVGVAIDGLQRPLGVLELHLLLPVPLRGNLLLALPQLGRCANVARLLLLLLVELLHELLDLLTLLRAVAPGVAYREPWATLVTTGGLPRPLVTTWTTAPTSRYSSSGGGSSSKRLVVVVAASLLLLPIFVFFAALSSSICFRLAGFPYLWGRL